jgi:beta-N-acetylhexosaminidase
MERRAFITGLAGPVLAGEERTFLRDSQPAGLIVFARNIENPEQLKRLIAEAHAAIGAEALVLVDQEGGRVQRLRPPHWRALPSGAMYAARAKVDLAAAAREARLVSQLVAQDLRDLGINCNCAPVLDLPVAGAHDVIGTRALGHAPNVIITLGRAIAEGLMAGGVVPVMKHIPGHGRARADTHVELPSVSETLSELTETDFAPFKALSHLPAAMTAHIKFVALDANATASTSPLVIGQIIRGLIGFSGLLISDDLSMQALSGSLFERASAALAAGTDLALHCNGRMTEMMEVASASPELSAQSAQRLERALAVTRNVTAFDRLEAESCVQRCLGAAA